MKVGVLGATGAVGRQMLTCMEEHGIVAEELRLFASRRSQGKPLSCMGRTWEVEVPDARRFEGLDVVFGAVDADLSRSYAPAIQAAGALYIDNSSAFRMDPEIPLVVPQINGRDVLNAKKGIIANPNCSTIITLMAVAPLHRISPLRAIIASTYQAVSGAGNRGIEELEMEQKALQEGKEFTASVFPAQIANNCIPWIGSAKESGYTSEELKMRNEGRKILHDPELKVTCTCVRVPVFRSHSISVSVQCNRPISLEEAGEAIAHFPGDVLFDEGWPTPLMTSGQDQVYVGRLRPDPVLEGGIALWCCGDQIRKGAAANAVEILDYILVNRV